MLRATWPGPAYSVLLPGRPGLQKSAQAAKSGLARPVYHLWKGARPGCRLPDPCWSLIWMVILWQGTMISCHSLWNTTSIVSNMMVWSNIRHLCEVSNLSGLLRVWKKVCQYFLLPRCSRNELCEYKVIDESVGRQSMLMIFLCVRTRILSMQLFQRGVL
jgi:hypothetical protein